MIKLQTTYANAVGTNLMLHETTADMNHDIAKIIACRIMENKNPKDIVPCNSTGKILRLHDIFYFEKEITATPRKTTIRKCVLNKAHELLPWIL